MDVGDYLALGALLVSLVIGIYTARSTAQVQDRGTSATHDVTSGELALKIAQDAQKEIKEQKAELRELKTWQTTVRVAWREHEEYDEMILDKLEELAPGTRASLPPRPPLPID